MLSICKVVNLACSPIMYLHSLENKWCSADTMNVHPMKLQQLGLVSSVKCMKFLLHFVGHLDL